jgi:hypothetical protein
MVPVRISVNVINRTDIANSVIGVCEYRSSVVRPGTGDDPVQTVIILRTVRRVSEFSGHSRDEIVGRFAA